MASGIEMEVEGTSDQLEALLLELKVCKPEAAVIATEEISRIPPTGKVGFEILGSRGDASEPKGISVLPDLATCPECLAEVLAPANRRFGYPFTNCTLCGPRYSILLDIPYDRAHTTMKQFVQCAACRREYDSYQDRRFHAQPNGCRACGPRLYLWPPGMKGDNPFAVAACALAEGKIVALKGVGGFQLLTDARSSAAVSRLRERKHRDEKPFALLMPSIESVHQYCRVSGAEQDLLQSQASPIVLLRTKDSHGLAPEIARFSPFFGVMLPCSPTHHLLMLQFPYPVVATSGNLAGEPIATEDEEALLRLKEIADLFVLHNRPIARACDDSIVRVMTSSAPQVLRRARGYAPLPIAVPHHLRPVLAVGGHLKNTVAIGLGRQVVLSQHIGDLDSMEARDAFSRTIADLCALHRFKPELLACDSHPDYASSTWAREHALAMGLPLVEVQHHHAHVASCAAENGLRGEYLGVAFDGAGLGTDGTIWGGEFFRASAEGFVRVGHLRPFLLPGGEQAMRDCSRSAAGVLWQALGPKQARTLIAPGIATILEHGIQAPATSSVGRLFDAVAHITGVAAGNPFEGAAAMLLESAIGDTQSDASYEIGWRDGVGDWTPLIRQLVTDRQMRVDRKILAIKFHNALANWILAVAQSSDLPCVVLSGGVFQNAYLTMQTSRLLESHGFFVSTHHQAPANDGGLALGQAVLAGQMH
jgi:hydrogenase maturation protein HypF